jgi:xanthine dehydrogenase accessory factor
MNDYEIFRVLLEARDRGDDVVLTTVVRTQGSVPRHAGSRMIVWPDGRTVGTVGGGMLESRVVEMALQAVRDGKPQMLTYQLADPAAGDAGVCGGVADIFIEPFLSPPTVVVVGCGHVGKAVAELAKWIGFRVIVTDDRADLCTPEHIPGMDGYIVASAGELTDRLHITGQTYVAAMTRGQPVDIELLPPLLASPARYIGVIGSRRRWALTANALHERGVTEQQLARIHAPVGLELAAETPREIAVSVMAEIIMVQHGGDGQPMRRPGVQQHGPDS